MDRIVIRLEPGMRVEVYTERVRLFCQPILRLYPHGGFASIPSEAPETLIVCEDPEHARSLLIEMLQLLDKDIQERKARVEEEEAESNILDEMPHIDNR